jgi:hypothetical protein
MKINTEAKKNDGTKARGEAGTTTTAASEMMTNTPTRRLRHVR